MKALPGIAAVIGLLGIYATVDLLERRTEDRLAYRQWVTDSCIPTRDGESAIAVSDGKKLRCTIYSNTGYGRAPTVVSAAVMEMPL